MEKVTTFTFKELFFEPLTLSHVDELLPMYFEEDSNKFIPPLLNKSRTFYTTFLANKVIKNGSEQGFWIVRTSAKGPILGTANLNIYAENNMLQAGCHLKRTFWGKGYGSICTEAMINYGFEQRNLNVVHAIVSKGHDASKRMLEKAGMTYLRDEELTDEVVEIYQIKRPEMQ